MNSFSQRFMWISYLKTAGVLFFLCFICELQASESCKWYAGNQPNIFYGSAEDACVGYYEKNGWYYYPGKFFEARYSEDREGASCIFKNPANNPVNSYNVAILSAGCTQASYPFQEVIGCPSNTVPNIATGKCEDPAKDQPRKTLGQEKKFACGTEGPDYYVGNPINISSGNKFQRSIFGEVELFYNSTSRFVSHSYSERLKLGGNTVVLIYPDQRQTVFLGDGESFKAEADQVGSIKREKDTWLYRGSDGAESWFDLYGQLILRKRTDGVTEMLSRQDNILNVKDSSGLELVVKEDVYRQPISYSSSSENASFFYDESGRLYKVSVSFKDGQDELLYHYDDPRDPKLLTGITDERGVRYATWSYDDQGRAISSEHAGGAEKVTLAYNDDGSTTVTNALGKQTTYRFQVIQGAKRITAIEGEPTADCPAANSTYTYNDRGQVLTATDAEGRVTRYAYNDRGLEISRIEGEGTAEARTVTTEWDPERYRRTQVTADGRRTLYSYDDQGRLLSERTEAVSAN